MKKNKKVISIKKFTNKKTKKVISKNYEENGKPKFEFNVVGHPRYKLDVISNPERFILGRTQYLQYEITCIGELLHGKQTEWFDDEIIGTKHGDFFVKRSINYSKRTKSITSDDLF